MSDISAMNLTDCKRKGKFVWHIMRISLAVISVCAAINHASAETDLKELVKKTRPSVVLIKTFDNNGKQLGFGTGFFIDNSGHIISNYHVLKGAYSAKVINIEGVEWPITHIVDQNKSNDLIKLITEGDPLSFLDISNERPQIGEKVFLIGHPKGFTGTVSDGIISSIRRIPGFSCEMLQLTAPISPGSSGGPVLNMRGQVIGVVTGLYKEGQNLNFAVNSDEFFLLGKNNLNKKSFREWVLSEKNNTENVVTKNNQESSPEIAKQINEAKTRIERKRQELDQRIAEERRRIDIKKSELEFEYQAILNEKRELNNSSNFLRPSQYNQLVHNFNVKLHNFEYKRKQFQSEIESFDRWEKNLISQFNVEIDAFNSKIYGVNRNRQVAEAEVARQKNEADVAIWSQDENIKIILKDGTVIKTSAFWEENGYLAYKKYGGTIKIDKSKVKEVK